MTQRPRLAREQQALTVWRLHEHDATAQTGEGAARAHSLVEGQLAEQQLQAHSLGRTHASIVQALLHPAQARLVQGGAVEDDLSRPEMTHYISLFAVIHWVFPCNRSFKELSSILENKFLNRVCTETGLFLINMLKNINFHGNICQCLTNGLI